MTLIPSLATVKIEDFKKKMKTWPSDKFIMSESFIVGSATGVVPLSLNIYPNGDEAEHEGNVSVYVMNDSNEKIQVNYTLKMKGNKVRQSEVDLKPEEGYGTSSLYCLLLRMMDEGLTWVPLMELVS